MPLTNSQFSSIMRRYEEQQQKNHWEEMEKREAIYKREPRLYTLHNDIISLRVKRTQARIANDFDTASQLDDQLAALCSQKKALMSALGLSPQDFEPSYQCPDCKDTGYINGEKCHCLKQACIDLIYTQSNIREILKRENFAHFSLDFYSKEPLGQGLPSPYEYGYNAYQTSIDFVKNFDHTFENICFYGNTGVGKTFFSNCIAKELLDQGHSVIYFSADQLFNRLIQSRFEDKQEGLMDGQLILDCDLLIIDDLGTEFGSGKNAGAISQLFLCINERILRQKSTIISTNLSLSMLADTYTERIFSRISSNYHLIKLEGADIRIQKKILQ